MQVSACFYDLQVFSLKGDFRFKFGGSGRDPGRLLHPAGVCADRHGNFFVADRDNQRVQMFDGIGRFIGVAVSDTFARTADRLDIRPLDVAVTSQTRLVVLLTGIEGVDCVEVHIYEIRCSLPPPEVRSVEQIVSTIRSLRSNPTSSAMTESGSRRNAAITGKVKRVVPDLPDYNSRAKNKGAVANSGQGTKSQVCVIA
jgi:hypothetical protein